MEETPQNFTVRAVGIRYGMIYGVIGIVYFLIFTLAELDMQSGIGRWGTSLIALVIVFLAHKFYKDNGDGYMNYGQGIGIGFWMGLVASVLSSVFTYIYVKFIDESFIQAIRDKAIEDMQAKGQSDDQIEMAMKFVNMFTTPEAILGVGLFFGILILVVISLIISIFTQKPRPEAI
ncbi:MAG: DUF4199 domain-containing protein [Chryseolinea sp.]